jgi:hypothetical protein
MINQELTDFANSLRPSKSSPKFKVQEYTDDDGKGFIEVSAGQMACRQRFDSVYDAHFKTDYVKGMVDRINNRSKK